ncbi:I78 family peptidase inhibitor [Stenotrophomonas sp. YIM B06876]|uniref:I78 family peptidase inhibitor n=1 Tax=Stenotrophomonas sp. YIM B06876 TaxID=3060211 RepID=UPI0027383C5C|nr:I78 family peptidase inhibitor [Stenotrophomonas sp. YIM B06876]
MLPASCCRPLFSGARVLLASGLLATGLGGCLSTPGPTIAGDGRCDDAQLQWAVGQPGTEANMRKLARQSGAGLVNPIGPASIVSRDHRQDRLRVFLDGDNIITAARCE